MSATIIELQAENIKRIRAIQILPKGNTVTITGKNDQGKTSILDTIDYTFRGGREICEEPIRQGEKRARTFVKLSEELNGVCTIERKFTPSGTVLEIKNAEGVPQKNPQALLETIISKISFDPLSFVRKSKPEQIELLRKIVGLDFTELNKARKDAFDERTVRNRELDSAKLKAASCPFNAALPKEPISAVDIAQKLGDAKSRNANNRQRREAVTKQSNVVFDLSEDVKALTGKAAALRKMIADTELEIKTKHSAHAEAAIERDRMTSELTALQDLDETTLQTELANIQDTNAKIADNQRHVEAQERVELLVGTVSGLTAKIEEYDSDKAAQIEFAAFPMPGLSFDEERGVLLNKVPFSQGSQAKQLQAAVAIGLALNPAVKVILIRDGSLLDEDSLAAVSDQAVKASAQVWIEVVNSKDPQAIIIEDGSVK